jgi:hypothetical protein
MVKSAKSTKKEELDVDNELQMGAAPVPGLILDKFFVDLQELHIKSSSSLWHKCPVLSP